MLQAIAAGAGLLALGLLLDPLVLHSICDVEDNSVHRQERLVQVYRTHLATSTRVAGA